MADHIGQQLGNYRLIRLLGRGGFAEVYLGQHVRLHSQQAAVKILATRINPEEIQTFEHEADTIASLTHPHIVRLLDYDIVDGMPFLVMQYAPNGSLRQRHRAGQVVPLPTVVSYVRQLAGGLDYAHYKHLIHRDVKPDNMLLDECNKILLSDFGVATIAHNTTSLSAQTVIGTVAYMAPEQFQEYPRPASDQYALGISVYEWLTGTRPFNGTFTEIAVKHALIPPPSLLAKNPALPPAVEQAVFTALAKDPKERFPNVRAFAAALEAAGQEVMRDVHVRSITPCSEEAAPPLEPAIASPLSATIPPGEGQGAMAVGTVIIPASQLVPATLPIPTTSLPTIPPDEIRTPEQGAITSEEHLEAVSTSAPISSTRRKALTRGKRRRRSLFSGLVKRITHKVH